MSANSLRAHHVLIVDEGQGFGGTVVVATTLMRHLSPERYTATLASAADMRFLAIRKEGTVSVVHMAPRFTYVEAGKLREICLRVPVFGRILNFVGSKFMSLANLPHYIGLARIMQRERVALVHCNNFANIDGLLMAWLFRVPCILHAHGMDDVVGPVGGWLCRRLEPLVVAISRAVADSIQSLGVPGTRIRVLHNPISQTFGAGSSPIDLRSTLGIPKDAISVGIVGRVVRWKGQLEFVRACIRALIEQPNLHAIVVGDAADYDDSYFREVRSLAANSTVCNRIHFAGFVAETEAIYTALDVLVHASIEPEPFGLVITEAMSHGVAVIAANQGAPPELIEHGVTGFLENPSDTQSLSRRITVLAQDTALRRRIALAGQHHAVSTFDPANYASALADIYDEALARPPFGISCPS
jgi:glycosyltransferase involved in cell wall biosynthesis